MATPGLNVARIHKTLHHKYASLFPLIDGKAVIPIRNAADASGSTVWQQIHDDIHTQTAQFEDLAVRLDKTPALIRLSSLRLYDILVWMDVRKERRAAAAAHW